MNATNNPVADFLEAMRGAGIETEYLPQATGKMERFHAIGDKAGSKNCWLVLHLDGVPAGSFGNWKDGTASTWCAMPDKSMTPSERTEHRERIEAMRKEREAEQAKVRAAAAEKAERLWNEAAPVRADFPYVVAKHIKSYGAKQLKESLVIPVYIDGKLTSLQFVMPDGSKRFITGGAKKAGRHIIGDMKGAAALLICEGWATACTLHQATGHPVAIAFDAGNLIHVAQAARAKFPDLTIILCADDDILTEGNPGITKATEAARAVGGLLAVPDFGSDRPEKATDFNDMAAWCGLEAVKSAIAADLEAGKVVAPPEAESATTGEPGTPGGSGTPKQDAESLHDVVARLSRLNTLEYEQLREAEAQRLGVRVGALDKEVSAARRDRQEEGGKAAMFPVVELWPDPVNGAVLLREILAAIRRFIVCEPETAVTASLWWVFTWLIDRVQVSPIAIVTAPEKRCGKTQLLNLLGRLSCRPLVASNISSAAVYRVIEAHNPTLLIDEADSFLKENEELRGVINSGHTRQSAYVIRTVGDDHEPRQFSTWSAKAISGIGHVAETIMDRAVVLELRRKLPGESVQRLRHAEPGLFDRLASKIARFADDAGTAIERARPELPEALNDRAQDNWEPLLAIADLAGEEWPQLARNTALKLSGAEQEAVSLSAELLADIREVFEHKRVDRLSTADLLQALIDDDLNPWATYNRGKPMSPRQLAKRLGEYGIQARNIRSGHEVRKGYDGATFADAFARYLTLAPGTPEISATPLQNTAKPETTGIPAVADNPLRSGNKIPSATREAPPLLDCSGVADKTAFFGGAGEGVVEVEI